jgi:hypothetical protein
MHGAIQLYNLYSKDFVVVDMQQNSRTAIYDFVYCGACKNPKYQQEIIIHAREINFVTYITSTALFHCCHNLHGSVAFNMLTKNRMYINSQKKTFLVMDCFTFRAFTCMCH